MRLDRKRKPLRTKRHHVPGHDEVALSPFGPAFYAAAKSQAQSEFGKNYRGTEAERSLLAAAREMGFPAAIAYLKAEQEKNRLEMVGLGS